jgi:hypothetical protein
MERPLEGLIAMTDTMTKGVLYMKKLLFYIKTAIAVVKEVVTKIVAAVKDFVEKSLPVVEVVEKVEVGGEEVTLEPADATPKAKVEAKANTEPSTAATVAKVLGYGILFVISYMLVSLFPITILYIIELVAIMQLLLWCGNKVVA